MSKHTTPSTQLQSEFPAEVKYCECGCGTPLDKPKYPSQQTRFRKGHASRMQQRQPLDERFWRRVDKSNGSDACWIWVGGTSRNGYGNFGINGRNVSAHRFSYELHNGPIPEDNESYHGICVLHKCDNRQCVNPAHLFLGTSAENVQDMVKKGRSTRGTRNRNSKLSELNVIKIRILYREGVAPKEISHRFGISTAHVWGIATRKSWKHIP